MATPLFGTDVNFSVDWAQAKKAGVAFGWVKASQGTWFRTSHYRNNIAGLVGEGLEPGAYHFLEGGNGAQQADIFHSIVGDAYGTRWLDVEWGTVDPRTVADFLARWPQLSPRPLGIYTGRDFWKYRAGNQDAHTHVLWAAGYRPNLYVAGTGTLAQQWAKVGSNNSGLPWGHWSSDGAMQFSDHTIISGAPQLCDGDAWLGSLASLQAMAGATVVEAASTSTGADMDLYQEENGGSIWDLSGTFRARVVDPGVLKAFVVAHPERVDASTGHLTSVIATSSLSSIPERPAWLASATPPGASVDVPALAAALAPLLPAGSDPVAVAHQVLVGLRSGLPSA